MPFRYEQHEISGGVRGTHQTVSHIIRLIREGTLNPQVRMAAVEAISGCPNKDKLCEGMAVFSWLKENIRFVNDPWGAELLHHADAIVQNRAADCDDFVILGGSMLQAIGIPVQIVIIGANPQNPNNFSHIYLQAHIRGHGWVGFDPSVPGVKFGWEPPRHTRKQVIGVS